MLKLKFKKAYGCQKMWNFITENKMKKLNKTKSRPKN